MDPRSFSKGVDGVLASLSPGNRPEGSAHFPYGLSVGAAKFLPGESLHDWFVRCVDRGAAGDPGRCMVEERLAVFASVEWVARELVYANIQALKPACPLEDYYLGDGADPAQYLRLDLDYGALGPMLTHPFPHVHTCPDGPPHFMLGGADGANPVVDFIEFLYRQFYPGLWLVWARDTWARHCRRAGDPERAELLSLLVRAFAASDYPSLAAYAPVAAQMKRVWRDAKNALFPLTVNPAARELMAYP